MTKAWINCTKHYKNKLFCQRQLTMILIFMQVVKQPTQLKWKCKIVLQIYCKITETLCNHSKALTWLHHLPRL